MILFTNSVVFNECEASDDFRLLELQRFSDAVFQHFF